MWHSMQPIIGMIKKLATQEEKTEVGIICKIAMSMLYNSNRKESQIFQKIREDPEHFTANICSQTAVEVHWKTCLLSKSTVLQQQFLPVLNCTNWVFK